MAAREGTVLVTGATGSVGRHVVSSLTALGVPVRAAVSTQAQALSSAGSTSQTTAPGPPPSTAWTGSS